MRDHLTELGVTEQVAVVVVSFTSRELAIAHSEHFEIGYPILIDEDRVTYAAFGLERTSLRRVWGMRAAWRYLQLFLAGQRTMPTSADAESHNEDTRQLGGDFVVRDGVLSWGYWSEGSDDRPDPATVIAECIG